MKTLRLCRHIVQKGVVCLYTKCIRFSKTTSFRHLMFLLSLIHTGTTREVDGAFSRRDSPRARKSHTSARLLSSFCPGRNVEISLREIAQPARTFRFTPVILSLLSFFSPPITRTLTHSFVRSLARSFTRSLNRSRNTHTYR